MPNVPTGVPPHSGARRRLLVELYGGEAGAETAVALDRLVAAHRGAARPPLDHTTAWVIAYPDHVTAPDTAPLATLAELVADELAPSITGVHTLPLHPASGDGGFAVIDPDVVEPRFGDWGDVDRLASTTTWMADLVVNHLSSASPWFQGFLAGDPGRADFFRRLPAGVDATAVVRPRTSPLAHEYPGAAGPERIWTTFSADQVDLDYRTPAVLVAMAEVLVRYLDHGPGAVRLDAVPFLWKDPATPSVHLPPTHTIVAVLRTIVDDVAPGTVLVTETNVPQPENLSYAGTVDRPEADAVYQFPLPPVVAHAALTGDTEPLRALARSITPPRPGATFLDVLATHDGIGLRPAEGWLDPAQVDALAAVAESVGGVVNLRSTPAGDRPYELAVSWFALMGNGVTEETAVARHVATHAVAFALPGIPLLYLNSLFGTGNDTATFAATGHARDLNRSRHDRERLRRSLADPTTTAARTWAGLRRLLDTRRADPSFHPQGAHRVLDGPPGTFAVERSDDPHRAVVAIELAGRAQTVGLPPGRWRDIDGEAVEGEVALAPYAVAWLTAD